MIHQTQGLLYEPKSKTLPLPICDTLAFESVQANFIIGFIATIPPNAIPTESSLKPIQRRIADVQG
jgi:hypothetical protein